MNEPDRMGFTRRFSARLLTDVPGFLFLRELTAPSKEITQLEWYPPILLLFSPTNQLPQTICPIPRPVGSARRPAVHSRELPQVIQLPSPLRLYVRSLLSFSPRLNSRGPDNVPRVAHTFMVLNECMYKEAQVTWSTADQSVFCTPGPVVDTFN